jgi:hypothetical protein
MNMPANTDSGSEGSHNIAWHLFIEVTSANGRRWTANETGPGHRYHRPIALHCPATRRISIPAFDGVR